MAGGGSLNESADGGFEALKASYHIGTTIGSAETIMPSTNEYLSAVKAGSMTAKLPALDLVADGAGAPGAASPNATLHSIEMTGAPGMDRAAGFAEPADAGAGALHAPGADAGAGQFNLGDLLSKIGDPIGLLSAIFEFLKALFTSAATEAMSALDPSHLYAQAAEASAEAAKRMGGQ